MLPNFYLHYIYHYGKRKPQIVLPVSGSDGLLISVVIASEYPHSFHDKLPYVKFMRDDQERFQSFLLRSTKEFIYELEQGFESPSGHSYIYHHHSTVSSTGDRYELATAYAAMERLSLIHSVEELAEIMSVKMSCSPYEIKQACLLFKNFILKTPLTPKQLL